MADIPLKCVSQQHLLGLLKMMEMRKVNKALVTSVSVYASVSCITQTYLYFLNSPTDFVLHVMDLRFHEMPVEKTTDQGACLHDRAGGGVQNPSLTGQVPL